MLSMDVLETSFGGKQDIKSCAMSCTQYISFPISQISKKVEGGTSNKSGDHVCNQRTSASCIERHETILTEASSGASIQSILPQQKFLRDICNIELVGGWATPLKNMKVNWDDYSQYMGK